MSLKFQFFPHKGKFLGNLHWKTRAHSYKFQRKLPCLKKKKNFQQRMPFVFPPILQPRGLIKNINHAFLPFLFLTMFCFLLFCTVLSFFHEETLLSTSISCQSHCSFTLRQQPNQCPTLQFHFRVLGSKIISLFIA